MTTTNTKAPKSLTIIAIIAILWNLIGVLSYVGLAYSNPNDTNPSVQIFVDYPTWVIAAYATAVFAGFFGSIALLIKKRISNLLFILSMVCVVAKSIYDYTMIDQEMFYLPGALILNALIYIIGIYLIIYSKKGMDKGWIK